MIWIVSAILLACITSVTVRILTDDWERAWSATLVAATVAGCAVIPLTISGRGEHHPPAHQDYRLQAIAVRDASKADGAFFLGFGSIRGRDGTNLICWRAQGECWVLEVVSSDAAVIIEDTAEHPFVRYYWRVDAWDWVWGLDTGQRVDRPWEFHVPPGSITSVIDLRI